MWRRGDDSRSCAIDVFGAQSELFEDEDTDRLFGQHDV
jgi:hypothetical protein